MRETPIAFQRMNNALSQFLPKYKVSPQCAAYFASGFVCKCHPAISAREAVNMPKSRGVCITPCT